MVQRISRFLTDDQPAGGTAAGGAGGVRRMSRFITEEAPPPSAPPAIGMGDLRAAEAASPLVSGGELRAGRPSAGELIMSAFKKAPLVEAIVNLFHPPEKIAMPREPEELPVQPQGAKEWLLYGLGAALGEAPSIAAAYATGGAGAAGLLGRLAPEAPALAQLAARGAGAGLAHGTFRAAAERQPLPEALKTVGTETAAFAVGDPLLSAASGMVARAASEALRRFKVLPAPAPTKPVLAPPPEQPRVFRPAVKETTTPPGPVEFPPPATARELISPAKLKVPKNTPKPAVPAPSPGKLSPEITRVIQRGKKGAVRVIFPDEGHALLFDLTSTVKKAAEGKISDIGPYVDRVKHLLKLPEDANVGALAAEYRNRIIGQVSSLEKGIIFRAPKFEKAEFPPLVETPRPPEYQPVPPAGLELPEGPVESAAREMGWKVDETIGEVRPPMGLSIKLTKRPGAPPAAGKRFTFSDPAIEERFEAAKGVRDVPLLVRVRQTIDDLWRKATREYEHLPRTAEYARLRTDLLRLAKQKGVKSDETLRLLQGITINLDKEKYDLFRRHVILADLAEEAKAGHDLPFGFTPETLDREIQNLRRAIGNDPDILRALEDRKKVWQAVKDEYTKAMQDIGYDVADKLTREEYYRHQVLEYARLKGLYGTGQKLKTPAGRSFLRKRAGSELDINTDYLQAEYEVMAQMLYDIEVAKTIKSVDLHYNIADKIKAEAKQRGIADWRSLIPEGYTTWQPREGNVFYLADSIPARLAEQLYNKALSEIGITEDQLRRVLAVGGRYREFVVKEEVAKTLDNLVKPAQDDLMHRLFSVPLGWWKQWQLLSPQRWFKYNARNLSGDAEAVFVGNPSAFRKVPRAAAELYQVFAGDKAMTPEMRAWFERGGMQTLLQAQELGEINKLRMFLHLEQRKGTAAEYPLKAIQAYWKMARLSTDFREGLLRYASYLDYLEQIQKFGRPKNFGASIPEEVMALGDPRDMAFKLSNDLLGAYDQVSVIGQSLRKYLIPFWSWQEVNFRRTVQLFKNAARDEKLAAAVGRKLAGIAIRSPFIAYRIGTFALKAAALWTILQTWNNLRFPEEEKELGIHVRSRPHIIFGRDEDGKIIYFDRLGAIQDFIAWFGLDEAPLLAADWLNGKRTLKEIARDMAKSVLNVKFVQGIGPHIKTPVEMLLGRKLYPDVFKALPIRDRWEHLADSLALGEEYRQLAGKPARPYGESLSQLFIYKADPGQSAYYDIQEEKRRFMKKIGKLGEGYFITPKSNALYNFKLAVRYRDRQAAEKYLLEYAALGGTKEGLQRSLQSMHPLYGLNRQEQIAFVQSLRPEDREKLLRALEYYEKVLR